MAAGGLGAFTGWTAATPLAPFLLLFDKLGHHSRRFVIAVLAAVVIALAGGQHTWTLVSNRLERESTNTFWFGFWQFIPWADNSPTRSLVTLTVGVLAVVAFRQGWVNLPGAFTVMAITTIASAASFGYVRYIMLMPFVVYLIRRPTLQVWYLVVLAAWGLVPLVDFLRYGSYFADDQMSNLQFLFVTVYTNLPVLLVLVLFFGNFPTQPWFKRSANQAIDIKEVQRDPR